jgi:DNA-directed RNA polymerase subunit RPC12/RpoP
MNSEKSLMLWYACKDCNTEWETIYIKGTSKYECSYCGGTDTYFIVMG